VLGYGAGWKQDEYLAYGYDFPSPAVRIAMMAALKHAGDKLQQEKPPIAGDPSAVAERIQEFVELGFDLFQVEFDRFPDTTDMELFIAEVMPRFRR